MKFSEMYPKDRFYAADLDGKEVTLTFADPAVTMELLAKGRPSEKLMPIWHFVETRKKFPAVVTNGVCARALFGDDSEAWAGHKITFYPAEDTSGMSDDGLCVRIKGSPELKAPLEFRAQIGQAKKTFTLVPTKATKAAVKETADESDSAADAEPAPVVDPETGEVTGEAQGDDGEELLA